MQDATCAWPLRYATCGTLQRAVNQDIEEVFEVPTTPDSSKTVLDTTCSMLTLWDTNDI